MSLINLIQFIGSGTVFLAISGWFIRSITLHFLSRDIEKYKFDLKRENDREIEHYKALLNAENSKEQIKFSKLQERRSLIIEKTYKKIIDLESSEAYLTSLISEVKEDVEEYADLKRASDEFIDSFLGLNSFLMKNAIYFPKNISNKIETFSTSTFYLSIDIFYHSDSNNVKDFIDLFQAKRKYFNGKNTEIKSFIESEFRRLLGAAE
ncbi:hypothetical protein DOP62_14040 (plasmid) [Synechococcus elongatus PCC 11801]|uniref:Uncharacterized protein n=1 Tax=Synechococcus elongatus PCC 11801 TaxID=2219813 RepID=A0ACD5A2Y1_SYNEL